jgi:hypothetical protein
LASMPPCQSPFLRKIFNSISEFASEREEKGKRDDSNDLPLMQWYNDHVALLYEYYTSFFAEHKSFKSFFLPLIRQYHSPAPVPRKSLLPPTLTSSSSSSVRAPVHNRDDIYWELLRQNHSLSTYSSSSSSVSPGTFIPLRKNEEVGVYDEEGTLWVYSTSRTYTQPLRRLKTPQTYQALPQTLPCNVV